MGNKNIDNFSSEVYITETGANGGVLPKHSINSMSNGVELDSS